MKRIILRIMILLIIIVLIDLSFGFIMDYLRIHAKGGDTARAEYICNKTNEEILIMGSSRAAHHYIPSVLTDTLGLTCYNCGYDGCGVVLATCQLHMILKRYKPKYIIYELTPSFDFVAGDNLKYIKPMRPYFFQGGIDAVVNILDKTENWKCLSSFYRYNSNFYKIIQDNNGKVNEEDEHGYKKMTKIAKDEPKKNKDYTDVRPLDTIKINLLHTLIQTCKQNNIKIIFVVSPLYTGDSTSEVFDPIFKIIQAEDIIVLDHSCDRRFCKKRKYFVDSCHLSNEGTIEYSKVVASELRQILER